ncbi:signal peptidase II [Rivularia sp. PCC 7116]|uniref:signal peptidase II n=1 Tax=Rivularia sp. PCC 7116 TaxID=373994 RepID=UPI00029F40E4|nr:signal peptidase II [Rivularia sp. PCC 7116]AFY53155.1 signal peptidase II [Rivularia sp. PCC 7116]
MYLRNRIFWIAAIAGVLLDQLTKYWVIQTFNLGETRPLIQGIFHFTYVQNTGAAFSLFAGKVEWLRWLSLLVSVALMALALFTPFLLRWEQWGYGLILSGAMGNGIDRFVYSYVIDFLDFKLINFPVFNLADVFINIGIACLIIASFQKTPPNPRAMR